ncbi:putative phenylalanine--tRNA ligase beta subunit [Cucumispora dikerogammari]|nr:putative phenylalanine--tRNA ligase beta subunit [Cucumispora dikerogammari]
MPTLKIATKRITTALNLNVEELENILFDFGLELDEQIREEEVEFCKIEVPANRYDLLTPNNLINSLKIFLGRAFFEDLNIEKGKDNEYISINPIQDKRADRGYVASAIIYGLNLSDEETYEDFIAYQEILHQNLGRDREFISIGTHDFDKIKFPIYYKQLDENYKFIPLKETEEIELKNLKKMYISKNDKKMVKYCNLMAKNLYVFVDETNEILSVPPVINSEYSKLNSNTKNVFIEVTGTDELRVQSALKFILYAFRGNRIASVKVGNETLSLNNYIFEIPIQKIQTELGIPISLEVCKKNLEKMMHCVKIEAEKLIISVPDIRDDILHEVDLFEDISIPYGFNNFENKLPDFFSAGKEIKRNQISDKIRHEISACGFSEVLNLNLMQEEEHNLFQKAVAYTENPSSIDCEVLRSTQIPGLIKCVVSNQHLPLPLRMFEVGEITQLEDNDVGFINKKYVSGIIGDQVDHFEEIQGICSHLFERLGHSDFKYVEIEDKRYLKLRGGKIIVNGVEIGTFGIISPEILNYYRLNIVCTVFEFDLEKII